jgi:hypothetical protein
MIEAVDSETERYRAHILFRLGQHALFVPTGPKRPDDPKRWRNVDLIAVVPEPKPRSKS